MVNCEIYPNNPCDPLGCLATSNWCSRPGQFKDLKTACGENSCRAITPNGKGSQCQVVSCEVGRRAEELGLRNGIIFSNDGANELETQE